MMVLLVGLAMYMSVRPTEMNLRQPRLIVDLICARGGTKVIRFLTAKDFWL